MKKWFWVILMWICVFAVGVGNWDPDYGWHVRMGGVILKSGIPLTDPFSYTMAQFPFVDHEWLTNVIMYKLNEVGVWAVAAFFATIVAFATYLTLGERRDFLAVPMTFGVLAWIGRAGARPQVIDWAFFAGLLYLFWKNDRWQKWRWVWPGVVVLWTNLHGGFAVGVVVFGVMVVVEALQRRRIDWGNLIVLGLSIFGTFLNPYGARMWGEVWMQMTDPYVRWTIAEWVPFFITFEMGFWLLVTMTGFLAVKYWRNVEWWKLAVLGGTVLAAMASVRHVGLAFVMVVPLAADLLTLVHTDLIKGEEQERRWKQFYKILLGVSGSLLLWFGFWFAWEVAHGSMREKFYPVRAVDFLKSNRPLDNMYSEYGWGGYLIWKLPEHKVFIDGRMATWRHASKECEEIGASVDNLEACWAMRDAEKIVKGEYQELFEKYDVGIVLWSKNNHKRQVRFEAVEEVLKKIAKLFKRDAQEKKQFVEMLIDDGWRVVYEDQVAIVLERR